MQRLYIYRFGATNTCAVTGEKGESHLPAPLTSDRWRFWMHTSPHQIDDRLYGFALETAAKQIAARGYYLFSGSIKLIGDRAPPGASSVDSRRQPSCSANSAGIAALMTRAHRLSSSASFDPDTFNMLGEVLDEVWASISNTFGNDSRDVATARIQLATIVLNLGMDGQLGQLQITRTAARLMREYCMSIK